MSLTLVNSVQGSEQWPKEKKLWKGYNQANSPELQIESLTQLMHYYYEVLGDNSVVDTLMVVSFNISKKTNNTDLILKSYDSFFLYKLRGTHLKLANQYLDELSVLGKNAEWHYRLYQSMTLFQEHNFKSGTQAALLSLELAETQEQRVRSLLWAGTNADRALDKIESLNYFIDAQDILEQSSNEDLKIKIYTSIQQLYDNNQNVERSRYYCNMLLQTINETEYIDTAIWLKVKYKILMLQADSADEDEELEAQAIGYLNFSKSNGYISSYKDFWSFLRSKYISENKIDKLYSLYKNDYPDEFRNLKKNDLEKYYRLSAYFSEYKGNLDSANYYWNIAIEYAKDTAELYSKAHLTRRYAEFLLRTDQIEKAYSVSLDALDLARQTKLDDFIVNALVLLIEIDEKKGDYKSANQWLKEADSLKIIRIEKSKASNLQVLSLKNEFNQIELKRKNEMEREHFRNKVNYTALISGLFIFIVVSFIIFRQYRLTKLEKGKSDKLLLNILPEQIAQELKTEGFTKARRFDNVSILFCDIVGFTKVAERLSPEKLVQEIDTYFKAFDDIIQSHGLEKIKTIGDAYVAVGGMPQQNVATAKDVTQAALEFLEAIANLKRERDLQNRPAFNIRVGINTGSVVAGVVGSIKFQYDIWGDAVNIAARMEQNSEPGRINISKSTYLAIQSSFNCTYRGKIPAKNKGEIEMYFVENA